MWWVVSLLYTGAILFQLRSYYRLYACWKNYLPPPPLPQTDLPPVSVIVCAHNELPNLKILLPLLVRQQYSAFEIVVVEDTSHDGSREFLLAQAQKYAQLKVVRVSHRPEHVQGKKYALSQGIQSAQYNHLLLTDADCRPQSPYWIRSMVEHWTPEYDFVLGYSPYEYRPGLLNSFIRFETLHTGMLYLGSALRGQPYMGVGRNLAYRKLFFLERGGFQGFWHVVGGDDDLFVNRHARGDNALLAIKPEAITYSIPKTQWSAYLRQKIRHLSVGKRYNPRDKRRLGMLSATAVMVWFGWGGLLLLGSWVWPTALLLLRWAVIGRALRTVSHKLNDSIAVIKLPILDFLYVIYYISIGPTALLSKHIRWK